MASMVVRTWASTDLEGAVAHLKGLATGVAKYYLPVVLQAREDLDLDRQREIAKELGDESFAFSNYFENLTRGEVNNPKETWYEIVDLANQEGMQEETKFALSRVAVAWVEQDGRSVLDEIVSSVSEESKYSIALSNVFSALSTDEPAEMFEYIMKNFGSQADDIIQDSDILYNWARKDPRGLLSRAEKLPASRFRQYAISRAVYQWAAHNPRQILDNLERIPQEHQDEASGSAIRALTRKTPSEAAKYVLQIEDSESQLEYAYSFSP